MADWLISLQAICKPRVDIRMGILVLCLKLEEKQLVDRSLHIEKILIVYSYQQKHSMVGFCVKCCFMAVYIVLLSFVAL